MKIGNWKPESVKTARKVVREMIKLLTKRGWTQHDSAKTASRRPIDPLNPLAARFCMRGAECVIQNKLGLCPGSSSIVLAERAVSEAIADQTFSGEGWVAYNDTPGRKKKDVIATLNKALKLLGGVPKKRAQK